MTLCRLPAASAATAVTAAPACYFDRRLAMQEPQSPATTMTRRTFSPW